MVEYVVVAINGCDLWKVAQLVQTYYHSEQCEKMTCWCVAWHFVILSIISEWALLLALHCPKIAAACSDYPRGHDCKIRRFVSGKRNLEMTISNSGKWWDGWSRGDDEYLFWTMWYMCDICGRSFPLTERSRLMVPFTLRSWLYLSHWNFFLWLHRSYAILLQHVSCFRKWWASRGLEQKNLSKLTRGSVFTERLYVMTSASGQAAVEFQVGLC